MLFQLGYVTFEVYPFNAHETDRAGSADFAAKDVIGTRKPREFVGEGDEERTINGRLFPLKFGGLPSLDDLYEMMESGTPQILVGGDGTNRGWWLITKVHQKDTVLDASGIGKFIEFDCTIVRAAGAPTVASYLSSLLRLIF
ncbi:MAG: phage tail protein [Chelatococcus sp.]|nr:MAG: phage tail protein [Chelatococcus sp.]